MQLWRKLNGAIKDKTNTWMASIPTQSPFRNSDLEAAIIKATSHDQHRFDFKNAQRVFTWIRSSRHNLKPLAWTITMRLDKTRCWIVALKGLMLMHGVLYCKILDVDRIGRLPFDLSNFRDRDGKSWRLGVFVRAYFAFLDQRSVLLCEDSYDRFEGLIKKEIWKVQRLQALLDLLIQVKPQNLGRHTVRLILEAMDWIIIDILNVHSKICQGISVIQSKVSSYTNAEAEMAIEILQKSNNQKENLSRFFEVCKAIGAISSINCPKIEYTAEEEIRKLERIVNRDLKTLITEKWEVFDEDFMSRVHYEEDTDPRTSYGWTIQIMQ